LNRISTDTPIIATLNVCLLKRATQISIRAKIINSTRIGPTDGTWPSDAIRMTGESRINRNIENLFMLISGEFPEYLLIDLFLWLIFLVNDF
jgi:hypothetical protein